MAHPPRGTGASPVSVKMPKMLHYFNFYLYQLSLDMRGLIALLQVYAVKSMQQLLQPCGPLPGGVIPDTRASQTSVSNQRARKTTDSRGHSLLILLLADPSAPRGV